MPISSTPLMFDAGARLGRGYVQLEDIDPAIGRGAGDDVARVNAALQQVAAAGGGVVERGPRAIIVDTGDILIPANVDLVGRVNPGGYQPGLAFNNVPYSFVVSPGATVRLRRNAALQGCAVISRGLYDAGALSTYAKAMAAIEGMAGVGVTIGDGTTGASAGNGTDSVVSSNLVLGFATGIATDGSSRLKITSNVLDNQTDIDHSNVFDPAEVDANRMPIIVFGLSSRFFNVTAAANNGSGEIRVTLSPSGSGIAVTDMLDGYRVIFAPPVGETGASFSGLVNAGGVYPIRVINATQIDLVGSVFSGTYTSGARINPPLSWRRGAGIRVFNSDGTIVTANFSNNRTKGIVLEQCSSVTCGMNFAEGYGFAHPGHIGLHITDQTARCTIGPNAWSVYNRKIVHDSNSLNNVFGTGIGSGAESIVVTAGEFVLDSCLIEGDMTVADAIVRLAVYGGNQKGLTITGSAAALQKVVQVGCRTPGVHTESAKQIDMLIRRLADGTEQQMLSVSENNIAMPGLLSGAGTAPAGTVSGGIWVDTSAGNVLKRKP